MAYLLIAMIVAVGIVPMLMERFDAFNLKNAFIAYFLLQLAFSGLPALITQRPSIYGPELPTYLGYYEQALLLSLVGLAFFQLGYYATKIRWHLPTLLASRWIRYRTLPLVALFIGIGFVALAWLMQINGGPSEFMANREAWRTEGLKGQGVFTFAAAHIPKIGVLLWMIHKRNKLRFGRFLGLVVLALIPSFVLGFRAYILLPILEFAVVWHYAIRPIPIRRLLVLLIVCGAIFTAYGIWRAIPTDIEIDSDVALEAIEKDPEIALSLLARSKGTEVLASVIKKLDSSGDFQLGGASLFETLTIFIPRGIWENKPMANSERFTTYFFGKDMSIFRGDYTRQVWGGISPTIMGELYWQFWWLGAIFGMFFLGVIVRVAYNTFKANTDKPAMLLIYPILFTHLLGIAEAPQGYMNTMMLYAIALFGVLLALNMTVAGRLHVL